jgi:MFS transporter, ACS family, glucarate transporter
MNAPRPAVLMPPTESTPLGSRVRFKVLAFTVLLAGITYLDRVCISITAPYMMRDLGLSKVQMSVVFSAFTLAYGLFEMPTGWWADRVGTRRVLTRIVMWWSTFTILTGAATNYVWLLGMRFLFGIGEAGAWPTVARTFSRWFPASERGTAQGIFFMGAHLAGGLTPLLVTAMLGVLSWRILFVVFGSIGFIWAFSWYTWFRDEPRDHRSVSPAERHLIESGRAPDAGHHFGFAQFRRLLSNRTVLALCAMYFTQTYGFIFYVTWFPTYLSSQRGFSSFALGILAGLPLTMSVLADLFGGLTTDRLSRRFGLRIGRGAVGGGSLGFAGLFLIAGTFVGDPVLAAFLISFAAASSNFLLGASWGTCIDIGGSHSGVVSAAMNTAGQVGGFLSPLVLGIVVQHFANWNAPLYLTGALYLLGAICWLWVDPHTRVTMEPSAR